MGGGIRHRQIQEAGVRVMRFKNERVKDDLEGVLREIAAACEAQIKLRGGESARLEPHPPTPSPSQKGPCMCEFRNAMERGRNAVGDEPLQTVSPPLSIAVRN